MAQNPLQALGEHGQSVWLDFISRELVTTDQLQRYIAEDNVTGMTSNPTIFQKAVQEGTDYDEQLRQLVQAGLVSPDELFLGIAISDIQRAADTLRQVYDRTGGADGLISLELVPAVGHDTEASIRMAKDFWQRVERPNLMIKVPATPEGIPAIEQLIAAGININITLIFALSAYESVATRSCRRCSAPPPLPTRCSPTRSSSRSSAASASPTCARRARWCSVRCGRAPAPRTPSTATWSTPRR